MRVGFACGCVIAVTEEGGRESCASCGHPVRPRQRRTVEGAGDDRVVRHACGQCHAAVCHPRRGVVEAAVAVAS